MNAETSYLQHARIRFAHLDSIHLQHLVCGLVYNSPAHLSTCMCGVIAEGAEGTGQTIYLLYGAVYGTILAVRGEW